MDLLQIETVHFTEFHFGEGDEETRGGFFVITRDHTLIAISLPVFSKTSAHHLIPTLDDKYKISNYSLSIVKNQIDTSLLPDNITEYDKRIQLRITLAGSEALSSIPGIVSS